MAVPSTLHQKIRLGLETRMLTIHGDSGIRAPVEDNAPLLEIQHGEEDIALGGFSLDTSKFVYSVSIDDDFVISNVAIQIMKKMSNMPGIGLGKNLQGPAKFEAQGTLMRTIGLGYSPSSNRFEIFANDVWPESEEEFEVVEERKEPVDWVEVFAMGSLAALFEEDEPMGTAMEAEEQMLWQDAPDDPTSLIMEAAGKYKNWVFMPSTTSYGSDFESESEFSESFESVESELVLLGPAPQSLYFEFESTRVYGAPETSINDEINESGSAYFPDFEINCVDPDDEEIDFDEDIPKEIRSLIEREDERHA
ncbi:hypothetical protein RHMOL_Rhmol11G0053800 [Rhododendron molle]|uniref:Uncharacterized protein n=1 Tax=Rhododendron molle TaxID=49168 RepID=A0ACC0LNT2_RHOML|nr:hypothetical protein RHMOL_Rhmol11G0053800 [Rhododendron molle]